MHRLLPSVALLIAAPALADSPDVPVLDEVVVTSTREAKAKKTLPESVSVATREEVENVAPSHPAELLNRMPGVHVNNLGGEGHMTSIRQPITTAGVYLFLEDGIPTRPTGFFNHNGLYEVNIPQAAGVEVTRGPGSALYGSDAIGGIINVLTAAPPSQGEEAKIDLEAGADGWKRSLLSAGKAYGPGKGITASLNTTRNEGFRDDGDYTRDSVNLRWDTQNDDHLKAKTVIAASRIDQNGVSALNADDYRNNTETNYYSGDIARREVEALRVSTELARDIGKDGLMTVTPYYRDNRMDLMPPWMFGFDPQIYTTEFQSYGLLGKYRRLLPSLKGEFISGVDMDVTPSTYEEQQLTLTRSGNDITAFQYTGRTNYDFDAKQTSISPYAQLDWMLSDALTASVGARYDQFRIGYEDNLDPSVPERAFNPANGRPLYTHFRPDDQTVSFNEFSPKAGLIYQLGTSQDVYANLRHAFRAPTAGQLFRSGSSVNSADLNPVSSDSLELGTRGTALTWLNYEVAIYQMDTRDDIVTYIDEGIRYTTNAGETRYRGVEAGVGGNITDRWGFRLAATRMQQEYVDFQTLCGQVLCDYSGNDIAFAPDAIDSLSVHNEPSWAAGLRVEAEVQRMGSYYLDQTNTESYDGHSVINLRGRYLVTDAFEVYSRVENLTDRLYSTYTSKDTNGNVEYRPGLPRSLFVGFRYSM
jgi:iron complex outermembrane receptor protein